MVIYKITNLVNGKTYIGMDSKNCQSYFGSGIAIKSAIKKYGKYNFTREVIASGFDSYEKLALAEICLIAQEKLKNKNGIYNLNPGGLGCSGNLGKTSEEIYGSDKAQSWKKKISTTLKAKNIRPPSRIGTAGSDKQKLAVSLANKNRKKTQKEIDLLIARTVRPILCLENNSIYPSIKAAAITLGLSKGNICSVLRGTRKHAKNLTFIYLERK